jgi:hypothetical protein
VLISGFLGIVGCASKGTYFNDASIYAGLDYTNGSNPFAEGGGLDDRTVSNVGVRFNAYRTYDQLNEVNIKTTHHSAAFNTDLDTYDSVGFEMVHKFYTRKQYGRHY